MTTRSLLFVAGGIAGLAVLFWIFRPQQPAPAPPVNVETPAPVPTAPLTIEIRKGHRAAGPETVQVSQGDTVRLRFVADADGELHLHGYDLHLPLRAGVPAELVFVAAHAGRFEYELHGAGAHAALGVIEVQPR